MRTCTTCNAEMVEGYLAEEFGTTFCSAKCLDQHFYAGLAQEISNTSADEEDELLIFWTTWEDEEDEDEENMQLLFSTLKEENDCDCEMCGAGKPKSDCLVD